MTVVATGLNNPRGVLFEPDGTLLVAEAGKGGPGPCVPTPGDPNGVWCYGPSGSVTAVVPPNCKPFGMPNGRPAPTWRQYRVVTGLPSLASTVGGANASGVHDLALSGGQLYASIGLGGNPEMRATIGAGGELLGHVVKLRPNAAAVAHADLVAFEAAHNPDAGDGGVVDSNAYGILGDGAGRTVVADAAANAVLGIDRNGVVSVLTVLHVSQAPAPPFLGLPPGTMIPMQAVPTTVIRGPGNSLYIGELTGFPFPIGGAHVWRLGNDGVLTAVAGEFTNIIDIALDNQGRLLVLELAKNSLINKGPFETPPGALIRVNQDGTRQELAAGKLLGPGGLAVAPDGTIYVTNRSIEGGTGELLRIRF